MKKYINDSRGFAQAGLLLLALAGVLVFMFVSGTVPFKNQLFSSLFPKSESRAMMMGGSADDCMINGMPATDSMAFCDQFIMPASGAQRGRGGDLDISRWSFSRLTSDVNPNQGALNDFPATNAQFCRIKKTLVPDNDSFFCGLEFNEPNHWMESFNDNGNYAMDSARITQPFDFAGRTGVISFDVDDHNLGEHDIWPEVWITDEPVQSPHTDHPGTHEFPRNGVAFILNCGNGNGTSSALRSIELFKNYAESSAGINMCGSSFTTEADNANHFEVHISQNTIEFWGSDKGGANFRKLATANNVNLPFTRGYVHFQHAQYNAAKFGTTDTGTFHWHALGFDGPVIPADRMYQVPDNLTNNGSGKNTAYITPFTYTFNNVNLSNVKQAYLTINTYFFDNTQAVDYTVNGVGHTFNSPVSIGWQWGYLAIPVSLSELKTGSNTVTIKTTGACHFSCTPIANIDLDLQLQDTAPFTKFMNPAVPCVTPYPGFTAAPCEGAGTPMPSSTMMPSATPTPMPMPSGSAMPSPTPTKTPTPKPTASPIASATPKPGDIDGNNKVDLFDYNILLTNFGKTGTNLGGDFDHNNKVDIFDYNILITNFGK